MKTRKLIEKIIVYGIIFGSCINPSLLVELDKRSIMIKENK